jgi:hypothetical protein
VIRRLLLLSVLLLPAPLRAQESDRRELNDDLGRNTVQELSARLMQMKGKIDPLSLKKMIDEMKKNPNLTKEDMFKKAAEQSGLSKAQVEQFMPMINDPAFLEKLKGMLGDAGKGGPGLSAPQLEDIAKKLNAAAPKVDPKISGFEAGLFPNMPKGSMPDLSPTAKSVMGFWENNLGSLNDSPAVKDAIQKMFASGLNADGTPTNFFGHMEQSGYSSQGFANWLNSSSSGPGWRWPKWLGGGATSGSYGGGSWSWGSGSATAGETGKLPEAGSWWSVVILVLVAGGGLVLWWLWPRLMQGGATKEADAAAPKFDIDPNGVIDRETLIKVFETLSLSLIGEDAKVWTHSTLGHALREFLATNPSAADRLAVIYALARYTPTDEPFPPGNLQEARAHLGTLAGVPAE